MKIKRMTKLKDRLTGLTDAIARYPLTTVFLLAAAIINAYDISTGKVNTKLLLTFIVGAFLGAVSQTAYERFFSKFSARLILMGAAALLTAGYCLIIQPAPQLSMEIEIRTTVALFALLISFIWVPVIKSKISFNKSFMITFKSFFNSLFFSAIIFGGINIILFAINTLIFAINNNAFSHTSNLVFILFAPMYFLSLIPVYPGGADPENLKQQEKIEKAAHCPKFLEILISYILIPLLAVFTLILAVYIIKNIGGKFWTDNLLEPMLVSYSITVILLYILASEIENKFSAFFRKIFPKVLVPIVLFQITSSLLSLTDTGVTHTRYYVILFGIYAAIAGILLSFLPVRKNGTIAAMLIIFAVVSIIPPIDAFTVSRISQANTLKNALVKNNMFVNNQIKPSGSISDKDKKTITNAVNYLSMMNYTKEIKWMPKNYKPYDDFYKTFGFKEYQDQVNPIQSVYLALAPSSPISITGYDAFVQTDIFMNGKIKNENACVIEKGGKNYTLVKELNNNYINLKLMDAKNQELISFNTQEIFKKFYNYQGIKEQLSAEDATFTKENGLAKIKIVVQGVGIEKQNEQNNSGTLYVFVKIK